MPGEEHRPTPEEYLLAAQAMLQAGTLQPHQYSQIPLELSVTHALMKAQVLTLMGLTAALTQAFGGSATPSSAASDGVSGSGGSPSTAS